MRTSLLLLLAGSAITSQAQSILPQEATITFYSHGVTVLGGMPGHEPGAFKGRLFDDDHQLTFMEPGHFVTFRFTPGTHVLTAASWMAKTAKSGVHLNVNLTAGEHYFVEVSVHDNSLGGGGFHIQEVVCDAAQRDNSTTKPLEAQHLRPDGLSRVITDKNFPSCSDSTN